MPNDISLQLRKINLISIDFRRQWSWHTSDLFVNTDLVWMMFLFVVKIDNTKKVFVHLPLGSISRQSLVTALSTVIELRLKWWYLEDYFRVPCLIKMDYAISDVVFTFQLAEVLPLCFWTAGSGFVSRLNNSFAKYGSKYTKFAEKNKQRKNWWFPSFSNHDLPFPPLGSASKFRNWPINHKTVHLDEPLWIFATPMRSLAANIWLNYLHHIN